MSYNLRCTQNSFVSGVHLMIPLLKKASRLIITCKETGKGAQHSSTLQVVLHPPWATSLSPSSPSCSQSCSPAVRKFSASRWSRSPLSGLVDLSKRCQLPSCPDYSCSLDVSETFARTWRTGCSSESLAAGWAGCSVGDRGRARLPLGAWGVGQRWATESARPSSPPPSASPSRPGCCSPRWRTGPHLRQGPCSPRSPASKPSSPWSTLAVDSRLELLLLDRAGKNKFHLSLTFPGWALLILDRIFFIKKANFVKMVLKCSFVRTKHYQFTLNLFSSVNR